MILDLFFCCSKPQPDAHPGLIWKLLDVRATAYNSKFESSMRYNGRKISVRVPGWDLGPLKKFKKKKDQTQHMLINILTLLSNMSRVKVFLACSPDDNVLSGFLLKSRDDGLSHRSEVGALREKQEHIVCAFVRVVGSGD